MSKGAARRAAARKSAGESRRRPGTGEPVDSLRIVDEDGVIPARIRSGLTDVQLAQLVAEATRLSGQLRAWQRDRLGLVVQLRGHGQSWESVGWFLGITGEAARQQYGRILEELDELSEPD